MKIFESFKESQNKTIWYIVKWDIDGNTETLKTYLSFDKDAIQKEFDQFAMELEDDEELHFMKDDNKYIGEYILSVVKQKGQLKQEITKGNKTYYKKYEIK